jgi:iron complex outermembrane receptor protein
VTKNDFSFGTHARNLLRVAVFAGALAALDIQTTVCTAAGEKSSTDEGLEEIVVTAQKRVESLQETPISVTAVTGAELTTRHIYDPTQLTYIVPSLQTESFNASVGGQVYAVRGIGTLSFSASIEQSVATVVDDVAMGRPEFGFMNLADVQQVEVLNGPQGMLFGKNASAGLINIKTNDPKLDEYEAVGRGEYGWMTTPGHGTEHQVQGTLNLPAGDTSALRINVFSNRHDPLVQDLLNVGGSDFGQAQTGMRAKFLWKPNEDLRVTLASDFAGSSGEGPGATADRSVVVGGLYQPLDAAIGITPGPANAYLSSDAPTNNQFHVGGLQANVAYNLSGGFSLTDIVAYRKYWNRQIFDVDNHQVDVFNTNDGRQNYAMLSEELRLTSPTGTLVEYQTGLYYYDSTLRANGTLRGNLGAGPPPPFTSILGLIDSSVEDIRSYALFGQATIHVLPRARLIVGGRETYDDLQLRSHSDQDGALASLGLPGVNDADQFAHKANFSWRTIGQYDITDETMAYVSFARGYKGPGFNVAFTIGLPTVQPEYPTDAEVGIKSSFFGNRLIFNASAFDERVKGFQAQTYNVAQQSYEIANAGELKSRGFEATVSALAARDLKLSLGASYVDAYFASFTGDQCYVGQPASSCFVQSGGTAPTGDSTGNALPNAPRWSGTVALDYRHSISQSLDAVLNLSEYARARVNFSSNADPNTVQSGYALTDASLGVSADDGAWQAAVFCRNCFDKRFVTFIEANPLEAASYGQQFGINSFRTIGLTIEYHH